MEPAVASLLTAVFFALFIILFVVFTGGFNRFGLALEVFSKIRRDAALAERMRDALHPPPPPPPPRPSAEPLRLLAVLQRESRLVDFLMENISGATDDQVGAAMKDLQPKAQSALKKHLDLETVLPESEGDTVEVRSGFDPSAVQLLGNVTGKPPFKGTLRHAGWRVKEIKLAKPPEGQDEFVLAPAEVELP